MTRPTRRRAIVAFAGVLAVLAGTFRVWGWSIPNPLRQSINNVRGYAAWRQRSQSAPEAPPFTGLAASQVGYGPAVRKEFSSPASFDAFQVVREDGTVAFEGGPPVHEIATDAYGAVRTVYIGDFTPLRAPGRYRIVASNGLASYPFDIGANVLDEATRAVQRAFYYQRSFTAIESRYARGPWVHDSDADLAPPGVVKGWHDAGDFSVYSASINSALFWMLSAAADFAPPQDDTGIPESGNGVPDLLDEARWGLEWILSTQQPGGGFVNTTCQERYGPYGTNRPERMPRYRAGEVGTMATARAVGTLAFAAPLYRPYDAAFAVRLLAAAEAGHRFLGDHPNENSDGPSCPAFRQDGDVAAGRHVRLYAAAGLLLATDDLRYDAEFQAALEPIENDPSYLRFNVYAALVYLRAPAGDVRRRHDIVRQLRQRADAVQADGAKHAFRWAGRDFWGSIAAGFQRTSGASAPFCLADPAVSKADCEQALANVHHALGRNYQQIAYVSGLNGVTRGRVRAFHHWLAALDAKPFLFPGMVAGGPNASPESEDRSMPHARPLPIWGYWGDPAMPRDRSTPFEARYTDNDSWSTNEIDIDWQGVSLYALHLARWLTAGGGGRPGALLPYLVDAHASPAR